MKWTLPLTLLGSLVILAGCGTSSTNTVNTTNSVSTLHHPSTSQGSRTTGAPKPEVPRVTVKQTGDLPFKSVGTSLAVGPGGDVYSVGGYDGLQSLTDCLRFGNEGAVLLAGHLPEKSHDTAVGFLGSDLYVFGGGQSQSYNTIVRVRSGTSSVTGRLSRPLSDAVALPYRLHGQDGLAVIGGYDGSRYRMTAQFVTMSNGKLVWTPLFNMPVGLRYTAVGVAKDGSVYMAGGLTPHGTLSTVWVWHPGTTKAVKFSTLPVSLQKAAAFVSSNELYIVGGVSQNDTVASTIFAVDLKSGKVRVAGSLPVPLADMGYVQNGSTGYMAGGMKSDKSSDYQKAIYVLHWSS